MNNSIRDEAIGRHNAIQYAFNETLTEVKSSGKEITEEIIRNSLFMRAKSCICEDEYVFNVEDLASALYKMMGDK